MSYHAFSAYDYLRIIPRPETKKMPRPKVSHNLTATMVNALKPKKKRVYYFDKNLPCFCVSVTPNGAKSYSVVYMHAGRFRRYTIGTTDQFTLADARDKAREIRRTAAKGADPASEKKRKRQVEIKTFENLAEAYMERYAKRKKSWKEDQRIIDSYLKRFKNVPVTEVKRADVRAMLDELGERIIANRVLACIRKIYNCAISMDLVENNPCSKIKPPAIEVRRERDLNEDEIKALWKAFDQEPILMKALFQLRLITAQRGGEIASIRWENIKSENGKTWWELPTRSTKNKKLHVVPLAERAVQILETLRKKQSKLKNEKKRDSPYVFYTPRGDGHIRELQKSAQRIRANAKQLLEIPEGEEFDFVAHDLRRTATTFMARMGVLPHILGRVLNHSDGSVTSIYNRYDYEKEKREALEAWAKRLATITSGFKVARNAKGHSQY
jgi:integrase